MDCRVKTGSDGMDGGKGKGVSILDLMDFRVKTFAINDEN